VDVFQIGTGCPNLSLKKEMKPPFLNDSLGPLLKNVRPIDGPDNKLSSVLKVQTFEGEPIEPKL
jgi:hypothetical protein